MTTTLKIFCQFLRRDLFVAGRRFKTYVLNEVILEPIWFMINFGYVLPRIIWPNATPEQSTIILVSGILLTCMSSAFNLLMDTLMDLEGNRALDYERSILPDRLVVIRIITFTSMCVFIFLLPYFVMAKLVLGSALTLANINLVQTAVALFLSATLLTTLNLACIFYIKGLDSLAKMWIRFFHPMIMLGGLMVPRAVMASLSPTLGKLVLLNPLIYVTESVGRAVVGTDAYLPFSFCVAGLLVYIGIFICVALYFFKKKVDHI